MIHFGMDVKNPMYKKDPYEEHHFFAEQRGGVLLTTKEEYLQKGHSKLHFRCSKGHEWFRFRSNKTWCRKCNFWNPEGISRIEKVCEERKGILLTKHYLGMDARYDFQCSEGHVWSEIGAKILARKSWCYECLHPGRKKPSGGGRPKGTRNSKNVGGLSRLQKLAEGLGGKLLSTIYLSLHDYYEFQCSEGHRWTGDGIGLTNGNWCPRCWNSRRGLDLINPNNLQRIKKYVEDWGGTLLTKTGHRLKDLYLVQCSNGHLWEKDGDSILDGYTCPECKGWKHEEYTRSLFEFLTKKKFLKVRPSWLLSPKGYPLELDGFCEELSLAFEYNGGQHYILVKRFQNTKEDLKIQKVKDRIKRNGCAKRGISLLVLPYTLTIDELKLEVLDFLGKNVVDKIENFKFKSLKAGMDLENFKNLCFKRGGQLIDLDWKGWSSKYTVQCSEGHVWKPEASSVKMGSWCRKCAYQKRRNTVN